MRIVLFKAAFDHRREPFDAANVLEAALPHVTASLAADHTCHGDRCTDSAQLRMHRVTDEHLRMLHDAVGCPYREQVQVDRAPITDLSRLLKAAVLYVEAIRNRCTAAEAAAKYAELAAATAAMTGAKVS